MKTGGTVEERAKAAGIDIPPHIPAEQREEFVASMLKFNKNQNNLENQRQNRLSQKRQGFSG